MVTEVVHDLDREAGSPKATEYMLGMLARREVFPDEDRVTLLSCKTSW